MFIVSKNRKTIVNAEHITAVFTGSDNCSIKVDFQNGKGCQLGRYDSENAAQTAIEMLAENISKAGVYYMPANDAVKAKINFGVQKQYHISGKKTKGHGGS